MNTSLPTPGSTDFIQLTFIDLAFSAFNVFLSIILLLFTDTLAGFWGLIFPH